MPRTDLFQLTYTGRNVVRTVYCESPPEVSSRRIATEETILDDTRPQLPLLASTQPDSWPFADQALITSIAEGTNQVNFYATRTLPFARFEVVGSGQTCDVQISNFRLVQLAAPAVGYSASFAVSTTRPPWSSSLDGSPLLPGVGVMEPIAAGPHTITVVDAGGCSTDYDFIAAPIEEPEPTALPPGAITLRIRDKAVLDAEGTTYYEYTTYYYLPSTRGTGQQRTGEGYAQRVYFRPMTDIIDRWCVEPGVPPFREIQVHHDGNGGITLDSVDGATACQILCSIGLTATGETAEGYGTITALVSGSQGATVVSIDNFTTTTPALQVSDGGPLQAIFDDLPAGRYLVSARDSKGCTAQVEVDLTSQYGPRYRLDYDEIDGEVCRLDIEERDYTGETEMVCGQGEPVTISRPGSATDHVFSQTLQGGALDLSFIVQYEEQFRDLFSGDERLHRVSHYTGEKLDWRGYLLPEQYEVPFLFPPQPIGFQATDGLGTLSEAPFTLPNGATPTGDWTLLAVVLLCLNKCALELPLHVYCTLYPEGADRTVSFLETVRVDVAGYRDSKGTPWDCGKVLRAILTSFQCRLYQEAGVLWLERLPDLTIGELTYFAYAPTGQALPLVRRTLLREIKPNSELLWLLAAQQQSARGAVSIVEAKEGVGDALNQLKPYLPAAADEELTNWTGTAPVELVYQGRDKTPLIRLTGASSNVPPTAAAYIQSPATPPLPAVGVNSEPSLVLKFKVKSYGNVVPNPADSLAKQTADTSFIGVGIRVGTQWMSVVGNPSEPIGSYVALGSGEVEVTLPAGGTTGDPAASVLVRITQPTLGGATQPVIADIYDLELLWQDTNPRLGNSHAGIYVLRTGQRVSRRDEDSELFHMDTPYSRRAGTLLNATTRLPTSLWQQAATDDAQELGVWFVGYRGDWQSAPAPVLTGVLYGALNPGALLTDPDEVELGVYILTDYVREVKSKQHRIAAVRLLPLVPPPLPTALPDVIYYEAFSPWLSEARHLLQYETATLDG